MVNSSHLHQHPDTTDYINEAFSRFLEIEPTISQQYDNKNIIKLEINMGRIIGKRNCISLDEDNKKNVFYAQRKGRNTISKFVKDVQQQECDTIVLIIKKQKPSHIQTYYLLTAYIGYLSEKEPLDPSIKTEQDFLIAKNFWDNHALIYEKGNGLSIYSKSIIYECPWDTFENRFSLPYGKNQSEDILEKMKQIRENISSSNSLEKSPSLK